MTDVGCKLPQGSGCLNEQRSRHNARTVDGAAGRRHDIVGQSVTSIGPLPLVTTQEISMVSPVRADDGTEIVPTVKSAAPSRS